MKGEGGVLQFSLGITSSIHFLTHDIISFLYMAEKAPLCIDDPYFSYLFVR